MSESNSNGRKKVLIVDDEEVILDILRRRFERLGFAVLTALDGLKAIDILKNKSLDLVISDLKMPNGFTETDVLKFSKQHNPAAPVVVISGLLLTQTAIDELLEKGAAMFIKKPFSSLTKITQKIADLVT